MGENQWATSNNASIEINSTDELFLNAGNMLSTQTGTGSTAFTSDPRNPSPTLGGPTLSIALDQGPYNQISLESRQDVITFSTGDLFADIAVSGRVKLNLYVECNQPDADIAVRLVDVYPDGRNMLINDGIRRMRFRNGYTQANETFMTAGQVYNVDVELPFVNYTWKAGHELKVYISANNATRWDVNLQNGSTMYAAGDTNTANIVIHHSAQYPSKVNLPGNNISISADELSDEMASVIFPNPATNQLNFTEQNLAEVCIYSCTGQLILKKQFNASEQQLSVENLAPGSYLLVLNGNRWFRFVKQ